MKKRRKFALSTTQIILISFLAVIFLGSILLSLPFSTKSGESVPYIDALFTATTATCVTGLVTLPTVSTWSLFGHIVILLLIQIGGLGTITVLSALMVALNKKFGLKDSQLIQDAFNLNTSSGLAKFVKKVVIGAFAVEGVGALLYMTVFVPEFGARGIFISVFNMPPAHYIQLYRVEKSKELLLNSSATIEEIAVAVGFANASYFCKVFKSLTGMTPSEFAQKCRSIG